jgi:hypothetical protein
MFLALIAVGLVYVFDLLIRRTSVARLFLPRLAHLHSPLMPGQEQSW